MQQDSLGLVVQRVPTATGGPGGCRFLSQESVPRRRAASSTCGVITRDPRTSALRGERETKRRGERPDEIEVAGRVFRGAELVVEVRSGQVETELCRQTRRG